MGHQSPKTWITIIPLDQGIKILILSGNNNIYNNTRSERESDLGDHHIKTELRTEKLLFFVPVSLKLAVTEC